MKELTKQQVASIAARLLLNIYGEDMKAAATIVDAEAKVREGNDEGAKTLADALNNAMVFMEELVVRLKENDNED